MRLYSLDRLVNPRLVSDAKRLFDRRFGPGNWHYIGDAVPQFDLRCSPLAGPAEGYVSLQRYRAWLWAAIQAEECSVLAALDLIEAGQALIVQGDCKKSHGQVVIKARQWQRQTTTESLAPAMIRERCISDVPATILFDLDHGYLKVTGQGSSRCYPLRAWRWPYADSSMACVREDGTVRQTTVGAQMALLDRHPERVAPDAVPTPLPESAEAVRSRYAAGTSVQARWRCVAAVADLTLPTELVLLSDGSLLDMSYGATWADGPTAVHHYPADHLPRLAAGALFANNDAFTIGAISYRPL